MVAACDWSDARARRNQGTVAAVVQSTIWVAVARRQLDSLSAERPTEPSFAEAHDEIVDLYRGGFWDLLSAM